jgi:hypothetical protein
MREKMDSPIIQLRDFEKPILRRVVTLSCMNRINYVQYVHMKVITTTTARKNISSIIDRVKMHGEVFGVGRRNSIDALIIQFPSTYNKELDDITNINALSHSFDFLRDEPETYSVADLKKKYV